jgi:opacity protein-like surface antigen
MLRSAFAFSAFAVLATAAAPAAAQGATDRYVSISGGYVGSTDYSYDVGASPSGRVQTDLDSGYAVSGAVGARYSPNVRAEVALAYRSQEGQSQARTSAGLLLPLNPEAKLEALSLDFNGYYDFPMNGTVRPYVGAGVGVAQAGIDDAVIDDSTTVLNVQAMAGISAEVSPRTNIFAEARYQRLGSIEVETNFAGSAGEDKFSVGGLGVFAGVRVGF